MLSIIFWWFALEIIGLVALPLTFYIFRNLEDRGYFYSKILGLLLVGYLSWIVGLVFYKEMTVILSLCIVGGFSFWRYRKETEAFWSFLHNKAKYIAIVELLFAALLLMFCFVRMHDPAIASTEKPMDFAFLNAINVSPNFPPHDPWMAGPRFYISYYYFGYLIVSVVNKLSGIPSAEAFNIAIATFFALTALAAFTLSYNMTKKYIFAVVGLVLVAVIGNLEGILEIAYAHGMFPEGFWRWLHLGWDSWWEPGKEGVKEAANAMYQPLLHLSQGFIPEENWWWWRSTRVVTHTINEFPFFSFLMADMHPHVMALPFVFLMLALSLNIVKDTHKGFAFLDAGLESIVTLAVLVIAAGSLGFLNSWDFPTYLGILLVCLLLKAYFNEKSLGKKVLIEWIIAAGVIAMLSILLYLPFYINFHSQAKGLGIVTERTRFHHFIIIFGIFLWVMGAMFLMKWIQLLQDWRTQGANIQSKRHSVFYCPACGAKAKEGKGFCGQCGAELPQHIEPKVVLLEPVKTFQQAWLRFQALPILNGGSGLVTAIVIIILLVILSWIQLTTTFLLCFILFFSVFLVLCRYYTREEGFVWVLLGMGALLTLGCEFIHINDTFGGGELSRMNTVFKFYYQTWVLWAIGATYGIYYVLEQAWRLKGSFFKYLWSACLFLMLFFGILYPITATYNKSNGFNAPHPTLDGIAYLKANYPADYDAIDWIEKNIKPVPNPPVILEAWGDEYTDYARVSTVTGFPAVLGWPGHELQWRGSWDEQGKRINDIDNIYNTHDSQTARQLLAKYDVQYVYVGTLERNGTPKKGPYDGGGLAKFRDFMDVAYENFGVTIYKLR